MLRTASVFKCAYNICCQTKAAKIAGRSLHVRLVQVFRWRMRHVLALVWFFVPHVYREPSWHELGRNSPSLCETEIDALLQWRAQIQCLQRYHPATNYEIIIKVKKPRTYLDDTNVGFFTSIVHGYFWNTFHPILDSSRKMRHNLKGHDSNDSKRSFWSPDLDGLS